MATFTELIQTYNPLSTEGERLKYINIEQIVYIEQLTKWTHTNNRVDGVFTRIYLTTGELLDIKEDFDELMAKIKK